MYVYICIYLQISLIFSNIEFQGTNSNQNLLRIINYLLNFFF